MVSCQKDDNSISSNDSNHFGVKMTMRTYEDLSHNQNFVKTFNYITKQKDPGLFSRGFEGDVEGLNGFVIDSSQIKEITTEYYKTYTMFVSRDEETPTLIENIMIVEVENEITDVFLVKYRLESEVTYVETHNSYSFESTQEFEPIDYTGEGAKTYFEDDCIVIYNVICHNNGSGGYDGTGHVPGPNCFREGNEDMLEYIPLNNCDGNGGEVTEGPEGPNTPIGSSTNGFGYFAGTFGANLGSSTTNYSANQAIKNFRNNLPSELAAWWMDPANNNQVNDIKDFLEENGFSDENEAFAIEVIQAEMEGRLISAFPFVKYPEGSNYADEFPLFTNFLKNELVDIASDETIVDALKQWGSVTEEQIIDALTWGNGPYVKLSYLSSIHTILGRFNGLPTSNPQSFAGPDTIELNYWTIEDIEDKLENGGPFNAEVYKLFIAIVILHEYTHYGDFHYNGNMYDENGKETGWEFEKEVIGNPIDYDNDGLIDAQEYLIKKK